MRKMRHCLVVMARDVNDDQFQFSDIRRYRPGTGLDPLPGIFTDCLLFFGSGSADLVQERDRIIEVGQCFHFLLRLTWFHPRT